MEWEFGDGTTSTEPNPDHVYTTAGSYTVQLTVSGQGFDVGVAKTDLIAVQPGPPVSLEVSPPNATLAVQERKQFTAVAEDEFGNVAPGDVRWAVAGEGGSIADRGLFTADTMAGTFADTVMASLEVDAAELVATASVTIEPGPVASLVMKPTEVTLDIGATQPFKVEVLDEFGNQIPDALVSWKSTADAGTIAAEGKFTSGTKAGLFPAGIQVEVVKDLARASATADVSIEPDPLATIDILPSSAVVESGTTRQFTAAGSDQYGNEISELAFLWMATGGDIDQRGVFRADRCGRYEVTASATLNNNAATGSATTETPPVTCFTVNSTADPGDGVCDAVRCTLREAMNTANAAMGADTIVFNIPGAGPHTIQPLSALPTITDPVVIDGYTQPGASPNTNGPGMGLNTVLMIELDGTNAGAGATGLFIVAGSSTVRGLVINRFGESGVRVDLNGNNSVEGNFIGTNVTGNAAFSNLRGLWLGSANNKAGGTTSDASNLISGNTTNAGVFIIGDAATGNLVQGNYIGTDAAGNDDLGNDTGVFLTFGVSGDTIGATGNTIGGTVDGAGNTIAFNGFAGVVVFSGTGNAILGNSISANTGASGLGIELIDPFHGVTPNDARDEDTGANNLQNFPVVTSAIGGSTRIEGTLNSTPNTQFRLELFSNSACDPSGFGEGETFLGFTDVTTDGSGNASFTVTLSTSVAAGQSITATATDPDGNTSEFSQCAPVTP